MFLMDPTAVTWLKNQVADAADAFDETVNEPPTYSPGTSAFGNTPIASACHEAWDLMIGKAITAALHLGQTLRSDVERLTDVVDSFQRLDDEEADRINAIGSRMTFVSSHVHSDSDRFSGPVNDYVRAQQLNRLIDYASDVAGPVAVGSDDNVSLIEEDQTGYVFDPSFDHLGPEALGRYEREGFENVGEVGGTNSGGSIDHIHTRGVEAGEATLVDGGPSDHDGQAITYHVPRW